MVPHFMGLAGTWTHSPEGEDLIKDLVVCFLQQLARTENGKGVVCGCTGEREGWRIVLFCIAGERFRSC